jgi:putative ABC transport system ATP-binding protein
MVTHDNNIASFADKIIRIMDGKIVDMIDNRGEKQGGYENEKA